MHKAMNPNSDDDERLYILQKKGDRGLMSIGEGVSLALLGLKNYVKISPEIASDSCL